VQRPRGAIECTGAGFLAFYPEGGDPPGWMQERLGELLEEMNREEVVWQ
jgi:hypothetical protein